MSTVRTMQQLPSTISVARYASTILDPKLKNEVENGGMVQQRRAYATQMFRYELEFTQLSLLQLLALRAWVDARGSSMFWFRLPSSDIIADEDGDSHTKMIYCRIVDEEVAENPQEIDDQYSFYITFEAATLPEFVDALIQENGDYILLENGGRIIL